MKHLLPVIMALTLSNCADAVSVHSLATFAPRDLPSVPDLSGIWVAMDPAEDDYYLAVQFAATEYDIGGCRDIQATLWSKDPTFNGVVLGDRVCLVPIADEVLLETQTSEPLVLYRHFLVRVAGDALAVCGAAVFDAWNVWSALAILQDENPDEFSLDGLAYTKRPGPRDLYSLHVVTSEPSELFDYLKRVLPRLARLCDANGEDVHDPNWVTFRRVTPTPRPPPEDGEPSLIDQ